MVDFQSVAFQILGTPDLHIIRRVQGAEDTTLIDCNVVSNQSIAVAIYINSVLDVPNISGWMQYTASSQEAIPYVTQLSALDGDQISSGLHDDIEKVSACRWTSQTCSLAMAAIFEASDDYSLRRLNGKLFSYCDCMLIDTRVFSCHYYSLFPTHRLPLSFLRYANHKYISKNVIQ